MVTPPPPVLDALPLQLDPAFKRSQRDAEKKSEPNNGPSVNGGYVGYGGSTAVSETQPDRCALGWLALGDCALAAVLQFPHPAE